MASEGVGLTARTKASQVPGEAAASHYEEVEAADGERHCQLLGLGTGRGCVGVEVATRTGVAQPLGIARISACERVGVATRIGSAQHPVPVAEDALHEAKVQASREQLDVNDAMHTVEVSQPARTCLAESLAQSQLSAMVDIAKAERGQFACEPAHHLGRHCQGEPEDTATWYSGRGRSGNLHWACPSPGSGRR
jgi:hypothetical protein